MPAPKKAASEYYIVTASIISRAGADPLFAGNAVTAADFPGLPEDTIAGHVAGGALRPATDEEAEEAKQGLLPRPGAPTPPVVSVEPPLASSVEVTGLRDQLAAQQATIDELQARLTAVEAAAHPARPEK